MEATWDKNSSLFNQVNRLAGQWQVSKVTAVGKCAKNSTVFAHFQTTPHFYILRIENDLSMEDYWTGQQG